MGKTRIENGEISRRQVDQALLALGKAKVELEITEADFKADMAVVKEKYEPRIAALRARVHGLELMLRDVCEKGRGALFAAGVKTLRLLFGKVAWRKRTPSLCLADGAAEALVIERLEKRFHADFVRTTKAIDKRAILTAIANGTISEKDIRACGLELRAGEEEFYYEIDRPAMLEELNRDGSRRVADAER
jgi:phage host-nuclease inhibitor protein Gam